jgi:hypothetical protein
MRHCRRVSEPATKVRVIPPRFATAENAGAPPGARQWSYRWFRMRIVFFVLFAVFWDVLVGGILVSASLDLGLPAFSMLLPFVGLGAGFTYFAVASLVNRSTITLDADELRVTHGPVPWPAVSIPRSQIVRFEEVWSGDDQPSGSVRAIRESGRKTQVLGDIAVEDAVYLAAELGDALRAR